MSNLVIRAASVFEILCSKTNKQTDKQTNKHINAAENPTHATVFGVGNDRNITCSVADYKDCFSKHKHYHAVRTSCASDSKFTGMRKRCSCYGDDIINYQ